MIRTRTLAFILLGLAAAAGVWAQVPTPVPATTPDVTAEAEAVKARVTGLDELKLPEGQTIPATETQVVESAAGARPAPFYYAVRVWREIPPNAKPVLKDVDVTLVSGGSTLRPAAALFDRKLVETPAAEKRSTTVVYYFAASPGKRDWDVVLGGKTVAKVLDFYATVLVVNWSEGDARLTLPDESKEVIAKGQQRSFTFAAGSRKLELEVRGAGKVGVPWTKFEGKDRMVFAMVEEKNAPKLPIENLRKALPKLDRAFEIYKKQTGLGGGSYNIGTPADPVNVSVHFGRDQTPGKMSSMSSDRVTVQYDDDLNPVKYTMDQPVVNVLAWEKAKTVDVDKSAEKIVGEVRAGRFVIRATKARPSLWQSNGLFSKGVLFLDPAGYFGVNVKTQGALVILYGESTKEP